MSGENREGANYEASNSVVRALLNLFVTRRDTYALQQPDGRYRRVEEAITEELLRQHTEGEVTLGVYQLDPEMDTVKWMCFDLDPEHLSRPGETAYHLFKLTKELFPSKAVWLEASRYPDPSFHIWVFFLAPVPAAVARFLGRRLLEKAGQPNVELFPKQEKVEEDKYGNLVKLPCGLHQREKKWSRFLDPNTLKPLTLEEFLDRVEDCTLKERDVKRILIMVEEQRWGWFRGVSEGKPYRGRDPACILSLLKGVEEGVRNEAAIRLACYLLNFRHVQDETAWKRLLKWNRRNKPPLGEDELRSVFKSALENPYTFGCHDELLSSYCQSPKKCKLHRQEDPSTPSKELPDPEVLAEVERILQSPNPLQPIKEHLDNLIAGEDANKLTIFILLLSGKCPDPQMKQMILLKGEAGAGKTTLMTIADLFKTKRVGRFTEHALDYSDLEGYEVLKLQEIGVMDEEKQGVATLKFLSSDDEGFIVEATVRNPEGGFTTTQKRIPAITVISSTTRLLVDPQYQRRNWILNPDESVEQTQRIKRWIVRHEREKAEVILGFRKETSYDWSKKVLKELVRQIEPCSITVPFEESLLDVLEHDVLRVRGDYKKVSTLVKLYGILLKKQLPRLPAVNSHTFLVTPERALEVLNVALEPLVSMTAELEKRTKKTLDVMENLGFAEKGFAIDKTAREEMAIKGGWAESTVRLYLNQIESAGYLSSDGKRPKTWYLLYSMPTIRRKLSAVSEKIENYDSLLCEMRREARKWLESLLLISTSENNAGNFASEMDEIRRKIQEIFPETQIHNSNQGIEQASTTETGTEHRNYQKFTMLQPSLHDKLRSTLDAIHELQRGQDTVFKEDLAKRLDFPLLELDKLLEVLQREGVIFEPKTGHIKLTRG
jgi:hypothetical protein